MAMKKGYFIVDKLKVQIFESRKTMGKVAGQAVAQKMREMLKEKEELVMVFAAAPSQNEFLEELSKSHGVDWKRVTAFHLDEYVGLPDTAPQNFGKFLRERLFDQVRPGKVHYLNGMAEDPEAECDRYGALLKDHPLDIACIGIGENGHLAFNDPPVADFDDPVWVKAVPLDEASRRQQVGEGHFASRDEVPTHALSLTIPALRAARTLLCMVPERRKARAVCEALLGPISTACPASILRGTPHAHLYLERESA